jgi:chromosome segregation ATPase
MNIKQIRLNYLKKKRDTAEKEFEKRKARHEKEVELKELKNEIKEFNSKYNRGLETRKKIKKVVNNIVDKACEYYENEPEREKKKLEKLQRQLEAEKQKAKIAKIKGKVKKSKGFFSELADGIEKTGDAFKPYATKKKDSYDPFRISPIDRPKGWR